MRSKKRLIIGCLIFVIGIYISGCGKDSDAVVVDFEKTVAVERPTSPASDSAQLKVAVAAIISPKETFIYYRQLLDYIGHKMGREIQFIQRKTYGEINELLAKSQIDLAFICSGPYVEGKKKHGLMLRRTPRKPAGYCSPTLSSRSSPTCNTLGLADCFKPLSKNDFSTSKYRFECSDKCQLIVIFSNLIKGAIYYMKL